MAPRETRVSSTVSFEPLSADQVERLQNQLQSQAPTPTFKPGPSAAKKAAQEKAAAKQAIADRQKAAETGWVSFVLVGSELDYGFQAFELKGGDGQVFPGSLDDTGRGAAPKLKPGKVTLKISTPALVVPPGPLTLEVLDEDGDPLAYADYVLENDAGTKVRGTKDAHGKAHHPALDAGKWNLKVQPAGPSAQRLSIEVVDEDGKPLPNVAVKLSKASGTGADHKLDSSGKLAAEGLKPGRWTLQATGSDASTPSTTKAGQ